VTEPLRLGWKLWALAIGLAAVLGAAWTVNTWPALSHIVLPDSDDMARLAQVRDWLGGQRFTDLVQHRLGMNNSGSMHWSRLGDLGTAAYMLMLRPILGNASGDIWAAILWPLTLFALYLGLSARLALRVGGRGAAFVALIIAAFAFPAITMFVPGRIDHHGAQIVLILCLVEATWRAPSAAGGAAMGLASAVSLAIGLETAPLCVVAMAALLVLWVRDGEAERVRIASFGAAFGGATLLWLIVARPDFWPQQWCDGFTPASTDATFIVAGFWLTLASVTRRLSGWRSRAVVGLAAGAVVLLLVSRTSSVCLNGPYGATDPLLRRLWMDRIVEAQPLFGNTIGLVIGVSGLAVFAAAVTAFLLVREWRREWAILLAFHGMAIAVMLFQVRGGAIAAALCAPPLAVFVVAARSRGPIPLVLAWSLSAGLIWAAAGNALDSARGRPPIAFAGVDCMAPATLDRLATLPAGTMIAPIDAGAYLLGATRHRVLAAPYHRNNLGNRAAYDFWLSRPDAALGIARKWQADYVLVCPDAFGSIDLKVEGPGGLAMLLDAGQPPAWLAPVPMPRSAARLYRVLPPGASAR